jgi:hypothetical protein
MEVLPADWQQLFIIGEEHYDGGASPFIAAHGGTGEVLGLDIERDGTAAYFLNSSVGAFIETFLLFDQVVGSRAAMAAGLTERVRAADPHGYPRSEWRDAVEHVEMVSRRG